jgi:hypothetical protein
VSDAQVVVVRAPAGDVDLRCGGAPMVDGGQPATGPANSDEESLLIGKRYADAGATVELICTRPGRGGLTVDGQPLTVKAAKPLPASD